MSDQLIRELRRRGGKSDGPNFYDDAADALLARDNRIAQIERAQQQQKLFA